MQDVMVSRTWGNLVLQNDPCFVDPHFEQENFDLLARETWAPNPVFVDIGAHQGIWSTFLASIAGPTGLVHAFEPHPVNATYLRSNTTRGMPGWSPVLVHQCALGQTSGSQPLRCWKDKSACETGMHQLVEGVTPDYTIDVAVRTLDSFNLGRVDFIKIDVEHWEIEVLLGAVQTLTRCKPRLLVEAHSQQTITRLAQFCERLHFPYRYVWATDPNILWRGRYLYAYKGQ